jgi:hypothetical protein
MHWFRGCGARYIGSEALYTLQHESPRGHTEVAGYQTCQRLREPFRGEIPQVRSG